jgi:NitT/TauT family transport system substrate-binding protein
MTRADRGFKSIADVFADPGTVAMQRGLAYSNFLQKKYGFDKVQIVPSPFGDLSQYRTNPAYTMQCFVTSEPIAAEKTGIKPQTFLIAESGYNPYTTVVVTRGEVLRENPDLVKRVTLAIEQGWTAYLTDPSSTNALMHKLNPTMDLPTFAASAALQKPLIVSDGQTVGRMTRERWETLIDQLVNLKVIDKPIRAEDCLVND